LALAYEKSWNQNWVEGAFMGGRSYCPDLGRWGKYRNKSKNLVHTVSQGIYEKAPKKIEPKIDREELILINSSNSESESESESESVLIWGLQPPHKGLAIIV
jgi:hypothetical protein